MSSAVVAHPDALRWIADGGLTDTGSLLESLVVADRREDALQGPECSPVGSALDREEQAARDSSLLIGAGVLDISAGVQLVAALAASARRAPTGPSTFHAKVAAATLAMRRMDVSQRAWGVRRWSSTAREAQEILGRALPQRAPDPPEAQHTTGPL